MKKKLLNSMRVLLVAAGLCVGTSAWADHAASGTYETNLSTPTGTVGDTDKSSNFWNAHSMEYVLKDNGTYTIVFDVYGGSNQWNNFVLVINNGTASYNNLGGTEYVVLRSDNYGWGTYYDANKFTNTFTQPEGSTNEWGTDYAAAMNEANVVMKISRSGKDISISATITPANNAYSAWTYGWSNTLTDATGNLGFEFTIDSSYMVISSATQTIKNVVKSWDFSSMEKHTLTLNTDYLSTTTKVGGTDCNNGTGNFDGLALQGADKFQIYGTTVGLYNGNGGGRKICVLDLQKDDQVTVVASAGTIKTLTNCTEITSGETSGTYVLNVTADGNIGFNSDPRYNYIYSINVSREAEVGTCKNPTYSIVRADGTNRKFSLACETANSTIFYSTSEKAIGDEGWTEYSDVVSTSATMIWAYAATSDANSEVINFETGAGEAVTLNAPIISQSFTFNDGVYNPTYIFSSDQTSLVGKPLATYTYTFNEGTPTTGNSFTATATGTLVVTASSEGYTSNSTEITVSCASYYKTYTFDATSEIAKNDGAEAGSGGSQSNINNTGCSYYSLSECSYTLRNDISLSGFALAWAITADKPYSLYTRGGSGSISYSLNSDEVIEFTNNGNPVIATSSTSSTSFGQYSVVKQINIYTPLNYTVGTTVTSAGWATLYTPYALDFSGVTGLEAYTAAVSESTVTLTKVNNVPANTGVVLKGSANTYSIPVIASSETDKGSLEGNAIETTAYNAFDGYTLYILTKSGDSDAQFNPMTSGSLAAGKAYLKVSNSVGARSFKVVFADEATGISSINADASAEGIYSLSGQRVVNPAKGLYIVNGKKVVVK